MPTTFIIIRHGDSKSNEHNRFTGQTDVPLSSIGIQQAEQTALHLSAYYKIDFLYSSPLQRARQTALPISKYLNLPIEIEDDLKEINGGDWEKKTPKELLQLYKEEYSFWLSDIGQARCTNGENMQEVQNRAFRVVSKIATKHNGKTVAVITHAGVIRTLECLWTKLPLSEMKNVPWVENCSLSTVRVDNGQYIPIQFGDAQHLQNL